MKKGNRTDWFREKYHVNTKTRCWEWLAAIDSNGYGRFGHIPNRSMLAHRYSFITAFGPIPNNLDVCHTCDNPKCVNPKHLFLGTAKDNMADCKRKGRKKPPPLFTSESHPMAKLTDMEILEILKTTGVSQRKMAVRFNVSQPQISRIIRRVSRKECLK